MSAQTGTLLQVFCRKLVAELTDMGSRAPDGMISGEQIARAAADILRIDLQCRDAVGTIRTFPRQVQNLVLHAWSCPRTRFAAWRYVETLLRESR